MVCGNSCGWPQQTKAAAAMPHGLLGDAEEHRNLRVWALGEQFVIGGRPSAEFWFENGDVSAVSARFHRANG
jgi:hypothetical protein